MQELKVMPVIEETEEKPQTHSHIILKIIG